ncbi:UNVERIFIED_CONTAM: hypothetical protein FKN15_034848 [Acipenser sinensis]
MKIVEEPNTFGYKYEFCPFHNITQHEQSFRWNAYSGILGIWNEWEIVNNTFVAMWMRGGDSCGAKNRQTKVLLSCGSANKLAQVSEPSTCMYSVTFETPLVCHPHSLLGKTERHGLQLVNDFWFIEPFSPPPRYKYEFCPFHNITQHEQSFRWNAYSGILGIWNEWEIVNNTFVAMWMRGGDSCGAKNRQTKVLLSCGSANKLAQVSEPSTCMYSVTFETPLVCHPHSLLVYPTLRETLQGEWDEAEQALHDELITEQGYNKTLKEIFQEAGYLRDTKEEETKQDSKSSAKSVFDTLESCKEEYQKLSEEVQRLRALLSQHRILVSIDQDNSQTAMTPPSAVTVKEKEEHLRGDTGLRSDGLNSQRDQTDH